MSDVILSQVQNERQSERQDDQKPGAIVGRLSLAALLIVALAISVWAGLNWRGLSPELKVLCGGLIAVCVMLAAAGSIVSRLGGREDRRAASRDTVYSAAFFASGRPQLITMAGTPTLASRAYLDMARRLSVESIGDAPPHVDRLFTAADKGGSSAIFRLHHMGADTVRAEEELDLQTPTGQLARFRISVTRLSGAEEPAELLLWQVDEIDGGKASLSSLAKAPIGLFSVTRDGRIIAVNETLERWLGGTDAILPVHIDEFVENPAVLLESDAIHGKTVRAETRLKTRKGVVTPTVMIARWMANESGDLVALVALHGHTSRQTALASKISQGEQVTTDIAGRARQAASAFASVPFGVLRVDGPDVATGVLSYANKAFRELSGRSDPIGVAFSDLFERRTLDASLTGIAPAELAAQGAIDVVLDGPLSVPVALYVVPDPLLSGRFWAYLVDISARRSLEDQLRQSQKMQAIGQLAAGIAHDFNNLLTAIRLNTDELLQRHPVGDPSYRELQSINATGARAAALVKKLLAFSRQQTRRAERIDVAEALSDMYMTLKQTLGGQAQLKLEHMRGVPAVMVDRSQFDNVVMNLCVNARDAMEAEGGGLITIRYRIVSRPDVTDLGLATALAQFPADDVVCISVSDTGSGMSDDVKAKIFEPFFTTKEQGKGTGLGLATVYGVIQQSGGHLSVDSEIGRGTTFTIYLPAAPELPADAVKRVEPAPSERKPADLAGQGHILFVEDEAAVRVIAAKSLRKRGYQVTEAEDGSEALEILQDATEPFDLLLSDVVMPELDGPSLLKQGRPYLGDARVVFISGYAAEKFSELLSEEPDVTFLPKPFTLAELAEKVKSEIGEAVG